MSTPRIITVILFTFALLAAPAFAEDPHAKCCVKAKEEGKDCAHPCCVEAKKNNTVCEKCGGKKDDKKKPS